MNGKTNGKFYFVFALKNQFNPKLDHDEQSLRRFLPQHLIWLYLFHGNLNNFNTHNSFGGT